MGKGQRLKSILARYIKDASPEELEEILSETQEGVDLSDEDFVEDADCTRRDEDPVKDKGGRGNKNDDKPFEDKDGLTKDEDIVEDGDEVGESCDIDGEILEALDRLKDAIARFASRRRKAAEEKGDVRRVEGFIEDDDDAPLTEDEDVEDEEVIESDDEIIEDDEDIDIIPTDEVEGRIAKNDSVIKRISRAVLAIRDPHDRRFVQDEIIRATSKRDSQMPGLMQLTKKMQGVRRDGANTKTINVETQQRAYDALNPHKNVTK